MKSCIGGTIVITMGCWRSFSTMEMPLLKRLSHYVLRTLEEIDDTFGVVEYLALHFRADRLQYELSAPERGVRVLLAVQPDLSP